MMRFAIVDVATNIVVNIVLLNDINDWPNIEGCFVVDISDKICEIGYRHDDGQFTN